MENGKFLYFGAWETFCQMNVKLFELPKVWKDICSRAQT